MKKYIIIAAALATLASCTKNASLEVAPIAENDAIGFSAYTGTAATKGTVVASSDIYGTAGTESGIGVFAFYQPANGTTKQDFNSKKYATPDFMYNQQVTSNDGTAWIYDPVKYWPNNKGDQVSFFAYAPYVKETTWEDLGLKTDVNATKLTASFPIFTEKKAMKDYLFATPALNKSKQNIGGAKISFPFEHITSRVAIQIGAIVDKVPATTPEAWTDPNTVITVESIEIKGIAKSIDYSCTINADGTLSTADPWSVSSDTQDLILSSKNGDFQNNVINKTTFDTDGWKPLLAQEDDPAKDGYLFIAPQDLTNANLVITYTVATTNASKPADSSTITNVITKPVNVKFESGKAYTLNLLIGMKTVEISAKVTDWDETTPAQFIDTPANTKLSYFENGVYCGEGIEIDNVVWAPVNCGYTSSQYPYGKLYQWGRKYGQGYDGEPYEPKGDNLVNISSAALTSHPDGDSYNGKFYCKVNWYAGSDAAKLWNENEGTSNPVKSSYDPCPDGWRVPTKAELGALIAHQSAWVSVNGQNGLYFSGSVAYDSATKKVFLPAAGSRGPGGNARARGGNGGYWSSSVDGDRSWLLSFVSGASLTSDSRGCGYSVRCVQE